LAYVFEARPAPWPAAATLHLAAGGDLWRLETASLDFLAAQPALADLDPAELPEGLRAAALALAWRPHLERLGVWLGTELSPVPAEEAPESWPEEPLPFLFRFEAEGRRFETALRLRPSAEAGARRLAEKLAALPPRRHPGRDRWPLTLPLEAGRMRLSRAELAGLAPGDILLPPAYPAAEGRLTLRLPGGAGCRLRAERGRAEVLDFTPAEDLTMPEPQPPAAPADNSEPAPITAGRPALEGLEVVLTFELEKKILPLAEVEALAPGRSFPLGVDPLAPVTVTLGGRALAAGRLVDLGGTLGVQITRLTD
jgi:type III secretion protein Q